MEAMIDNDVIDDEIMIISIESEADIDALAMISKELIATSSEEPRICQD